MRRISASPSLVALLVLMALFLWVSFYGLNFGIHWDEPAAKLDSVRDTVKTGLFFQGSGGAVDGFHYNYGGVNYMLTWAGFAPEVWRVVRDGNMSQAGLSDVISPIIYEMRIRLRVRGIYLVLCGLSILWIYLLNITLGRNPWEAVLAGAILATSWEVQYHSRWMAPDEVMMQFVLLSFLLLTLGWASKKIPWLYLSAIAVGLAVGTKYNAVIELPFVVGAAMVVVWQQKRSATAVLKHGVALGGTALFVFIMTTPGVVIDPFRFFYQFQLQRSVYAFGWYGYTVHPGLPYFLATLKYFALQLFSHYWSLSIVLSVFCLVGLVTLVVGKPRLPVLAMTGFVLVYLAFFSQQSALIVRNLLVVVPFLCLATARGVVVAAEWFSARSRKVGYAVYGLVTVMLVVNYGWEVYAAVQVKRREHFDEFVRRFEDYARSKPQASFLVSEQLWKVMNSLPSSPIPGNIGTDATKPYSRVAFLQSEGPDLDKFWPKWPANWWDMYETTFGALEVNLNAYPTFVGNQRILVLTSDHFQKLPIKVQDLVPEHH